MLLTTPTTIHYTIVLRICQGSSYTSRTVSKDVEVELCFHNTSLMRCDRTLDLVIIKELHLIFDKQRGK